MADRIEVDGLAKECFVAAGLLDGFEAFVGRQSTQRWAGEIVARILRATRHYVYGVIPESGLKATCATVAEELRGFESASPDNARLVEEVRLRLEELETTAVGQSATRRTGAGRS